MSNENNEVKAIEVGDVVILKSSSPEMTVTAVSGGKVECTFYHDASGIFISEMLPVESLIKL